MYYFLSCILLHYRCYAWYVFICAFVRAIYVSIFYIFSVL